MTFDQFKLLEIGDIVEVSCNSIDSGYIGKVISIQGDKITIKMPTQGERVYSYRSLKADIPVHKPIKNKVKRIKLSDRELLDDFINKTGINRGKIVKYEIVDAFIEKLQSIKIYLREGGTVIYYPR